MSMNIPYGDHASIHRAYVCDPNDRNDRNPARFSAGRTAIIGGGLPIFNGQDGAISGAPASANFLSTLQKMLQDKGLAPAAIFGVKPNAPQPWFHPERQATDDAQRAAWNDYAEGVNMGAYRGGLLGLAAGAGIMLAALYFGGAMTSSPKPAPSASKPVTSGSRHRRSSRHGR